MTVNPLNKPQSLLYTVKNLPLKTLCEAMLAKIVSGSKLEKRLINEIRETFYRYSTNDKENKHGKISVGNRLPFDCISRFELGTVFNVIA